MLAILMAAHLLFWALLYIHIYFREQAVSHAKYSDESDYEDKKRSTEQKYASSWRVYVALLPVYYLEYIP